MTEGEMEIATLIAAVRAESAAPRVPAAVDVLVRARPVYPVP